MQKLELEQVIGYVPYDLEIVASDANHDEAKFVVIGIHQKMFTVIDNEEQSDEVYHFEMSEAKPLLIPLSQITKSHWFSILMQGIHQAEPPMRKNMPSFIPDIEFHYDLAVEMIYTGTGYSFSYCYKEKQFESHGLRFNQLAVIEELYKHHADIHNLIEQGLALNKLNYDV